MNMRKAILPGLCAFALAAAAAERPDLEADANSAADMKAEQRQLLDEEQRFKSVDTNGDGYIDRDEASKQRALLDAWQKADLNSDGKIDQSEFSAFETDNGPEDAPQ